MLPRKGRDDTGYRAALLYREMPSSAYNALVILGPTASGKTTLGVELARAHRGEIVSADSRQVYRGLDVGSGKDLAEYGRDGKQVPYHLIDIVDLDSEFNVFEYQKRFFEAFEDVQTRGVLPVVVGGTGLYLEAVLKGYALIEVPEDTSLRAELDALSDRALVERLVRLKSELHNTSDTIDRPRVVRAIEIAEYERSHSAPSVPEVHALILGLKWARPELHKRISERLKQRLEQGLVEEVETLLDSGVSHERLHALGLEFRYVDALLRGEIKNRNDLYQKLRGAIINFAKRQETWFRRMERKGAVIHWIRGGDIESALALCQSELPPVP